MPPSQTFRSYLVNLSLKHVSMWHIFDVSQGKCIRFDIFSEIVSIKIEVFRVVTSSSLVSGYHSFGGSECLLLLEGQNDFDLEMEAASFNLALVNIC
jgi:hypothetical protein